MDEDKLKTREFKDADGRVIARYNPREEGSLMNAYMEITRAKSLGTLEELSYMVYRAFLFGMDEGRRAI